MKKTIGILAHVDAGKTTFSEQLLYHTDSIKQRGRVDHKDAFLDSHDIERQRGITVFADQGMFTYGDSQYYIIDTPGHIDFFSGNGTCHSSYGLCHYYY
jgi:ribosomal protection tetracycline resistance protein